MDDAIIDRIYECSFVPELWPDVLRDTSKLSESVGASLFVTNPEVTAWTASRNAKDITGRFIKDGWYWRGNLMSRVYKSRHAGFQRDVDFFTADQLENEPIYRDNWRKMGLGWGAATAFELPTGEALSIVLSRAVSQGPMADETLRKLDMLRPHLARAAVMAARTHLERARAAGDTLAALGLAAMVLNADGKVIFANSLIEERKELLEWRAGNRVSLKDGRADEMLREALARVALPDNSGVRSFPVREDASGDLMIGHLLPIRFSALDIFARSAVVFVLMPVAAASAPSIEVVMNLFDLTPAEARVARGLAAGQSVDEIALHGNLSPNTIRVQVRGVLQKTGCQRQVDVVALLGGISIVRT